MYVFKLTSHQNNARFFPGVIEADVHPCANCTDRGMCKPLHLMTEKELRYHVYFKLKIGDFRLGEFVSFPYFIPSTKLSNKDVRSVRGDILVKERFGIIVALYDHYMEVVVLGTSNGTGPMNKPPAMRVKCFGIKEAGKEYKCLNKHGNPVTFEPDQGVYEASPSIEYRVTYGVNGDITNTIRLEYNTRIWGHGIMNDVKRFLAHYAEKVSGAAYGQLSPDQAIGLLEAQLKRARDRKAREDEEDDLRSHAERNRKLHEDRLEEARIVRQGQGRREETSKRNRTASSQNGRNPQSTISTQQPGALQTCDQNASATRKRNAEDTLESVATKRTMTEAGSAMSGVVFDPPTGPRNPSTGPRDTLTRQRVAPANMQSTHPAPRNLQQHGAPRQTHPAPRNPYQQGGTQPGPRNTPRQPPSTIRSGTTPGQTNDSGYASHPRHLQPNPRNIDRWVPGSDDGRSGDGGRRPNERRR